MKLTIEEKQMLGRVLVKHRSGLSLTQEKLCAESGIGIRTLQRAETGGGISEGNLGALAIIFKCSADDLIQEARTGDVAGPEIRLKFDVVCSPEQLIEHLLRPRQMLHVGPEGEHPYNEDLGGLIANLLSTLDSRPPKKKTVSQEEKAEAEYILDYSEEMGFRLFVCHYQEKVEYEGKLLRNPTTLVIAAPQSDPRVKKSPKGFILDYVVDSRRQSLTRILHPNLTLYDWMQDQLISRSNGEARVKAVLKKVHSNIRKRKK